MHNFKFSNPDSYIPFNYLNQNILSKNSIFDFEIPKVRVEFNCGVFLEHKTSTNISLLTNAFAKVKLVKLFPIIQIFIINLILTRKIR